MTRAHWIEIAAIVVVGIGSSLMSPHLSPSSTLGDVVLGFSALLLLQSLTRDVVILWRERISARASPRRETQSFCLESTIGATGVIAGILLALWSNSEPVPLTPVPLAAATIGTLTIGFLMRDLVISWNPWAVRREPDHVNLIVRWRKR